MVHMQLHTLSVESEASLDTSSKESIVILISFVVKRPLVHRKAVSKLINEFIRSCINNYQADLSDRLLQDIVWLLSLGL